MAKHPLLMLIADKNRGADESPAEDEPVNHSEKKVLVAEDLIQAIKDGDAEAVCEAFDMLTGMYGQEEDEEAGGE
jgi:hypothetical protein